MSADSAGSRPALLALDWGTSALRGYLLDAAGTVIAARDGGPGILRVDGGNYAAALQEFAGDWLARDATMPVIASGMIGSRQGWREAAYVPCPASIDALAGRLLRFELDDGRPMAIVPGVMLEAEVPDVMRGEETQIAGAADASRDEEERVFVLPGTHCKWVRVRGRTIASFRTYMTGELFAALVGHTILGRLMAGDAHDPAAFARGVRYGLAEGGLSGKLFSARTLGLFERVAAPSLHAYLSGLVIGAEIDDARAWSGGAAVTLIGAAALAARYRDALAQAGIACEVADDSITPRGLARIAGAAGLLPA